MRRMLINDVQIIMILHQPVCVKQLSNQAVVEALDGLPAQKIHCSVLAEQAIKTALADYYTRQGIDPTPFVGELKDPDEEHLACEM